MPTTSNPSDWALPHVRELHPYTPGEQPDETNWIKLNTNENPYPPSPRVAEAVDAALAGLQRYPEPRSDALRKGIAEYHKVAENRIFVGNGSDEVLNLLVRAFCGAGRPVGTTDPSYSLYPVLAAIQNAELVRVAFDRDMKLDPSLIASSGSSLFFLTSPNAPTGVGFARDGLERLLDLFPGLLVVDEAYAAFADEDAIPLLGSYRHLAISRTLSKSHGLAGLRVGYLLADPSVVQVLDRIRDSYNVNRLSQAGALAALLDRGYYRETVARIVATRDLCMGKFHALGWFTYPSQANFIFTEPVSAQGARGAAVARDLEGFLRDHRILVRYFAGSRLTERFLRISVGTESEMEALFGEIDLWRMTA
jgi:histidinol-phosphate aminotransferase